MKSLSEWRAFEGVEILRRGGQNHVLEGQRLIFEEEDLEIQGSKSEVEEEGKLVIH